jgi:release factor glutamine methyltransferase
MPGKTPQPTVAAALKTAAAQLQPQIISCATDKSLGELEAEILLAHTLKRDRAWLFAHSDSKLTTQSSKLFRSLVSRRTKHEPIAYITGEKDFYGHTFQVNRSTLIPRPESELLVDLARKTLFPEPSADDLVWDVGTGSGALAISIASHIAPRRVLATDVSIKALATARRNAKHLNVTNVTFLKANLLDTTVRSKLQAQSSKALRLVIVANLPYLPTSDKKKLDTDVVKFEPSSALFVGKDGTELIEKFLRQLATFDVHFSSAFFEFDPPQTKILKQLAKELFPHAKVKIHKDLAHRDRVLELCHPSTSGHSTIPANRTIK